VVFSQDPGVNHLMQESGSKISMPERIIRFRISRRVLRPDGKKVPFQRTLFPHVREAMIKFEIKTNDGKANRFNQ
jgi:hypothetical protein